MKGAGDFVSKADIEAERILKEDLMEARPTYGWLGEETGGEDGEDGEGGTTGGGVDITVRADDKEFAQTALNESLLREVAETSGGAFLREEDLHKLPAMLSVEPRTIATTKEAELWASPFYFILLLIPITIEWFLRKWSELK